MRKINIDTLTTELEKLKTQGETHVEEAGEWEDDKGNKTGSLETILKEHGEHWYFD